MFGFVVVFRRERRALALRKSYKIKGGFSPGPSLHQLAIIFLPFPSPVSDPILAPPSLTHPKKIPISSYSNTSKRV
jgi:hypothetical protein